MISGIYLNEGIFVSLWVFQKPLPISFHSESQQGTACWSKNDSSRNGIKVTSVL